MSKIGFRLIRGVAILFSLFVGLSADVVPTAWQSSTIVSQAEARVGPAGDAPQRCRGCAAHDQARGHDRARGTEVLTAGE